MPTNARTILTHNIGDIFSFKTIPPITAANIGPAAITKTAFATLVCNNATILQIIAPLRINPANSARDPDSFNIRRVLELYKTSSLG